MKTLNLKYFGVRILIFMGHVTSSERDHRTRQEHFPIGGQWWPCVYLAPIRRYGASKILGSRVWRFGVSDVIGHVTIGLAICGFLLAVHCNHASILHRNGGMRPQRYRGHNLDLLGSRDVIGHVTIGLGVGTFLLVVNDDQVPILHGYGDTGLQKILGSISLLPIWRYTSKLFS